MRHQDLEDRERRLESRFSSSLERTSLMLLRGHDSEDQLEFDLEIERTARRNRSRKRREQQT